MPAKKEIKKKTCPICKKQKNIATSFYKSASPLFEDGCVQICTSCVKDYTCNDDGTINKTKLKTMLQKLDKPMFYDSLDSSFSQFRNEHSYLSDDEVAKHGKEIIGLYFKNIMLRQDRNRDFAESERMGFMHQNSNKTVEEKQTIVDAFHSDGDTIQKPLDTAKEDVEPLLYSDKWMGNYSQSDLAKLDHYYESLENDYNIVTENHRDYARKIAKASLQMDKTFDDMLNGVDGADKKYDNATKAFDLLSKSAKFSESTRSVNDVGASSFSKVAAMVESHNWIPEHKPLKKDTIDEMLDYLSTITKSL